MDRSKCQECRGNRRIDYCKTCKKEYGRMMWNKKIERRERSNPFRKDTNE